MKVYQVTITKDLGRTGTSPNLWELGHQARSTFSTVELAKTFCEKELMSFLKEGYEWRETKDGPVTVTWSPAPETWSVELAQPGPGGEWHGTCASENGSLKLGQDDWFAVIHGCEVHEDSDLNPQRIVEILRYLAFDSGAAYAEEMRDRRSGGEVLHPDAQSRASALGFRDEPYCTDFIRGFDSIMAAKETSRV